MTCDHHCTGDAKVALFEIKIQCDSHFARAKRVRFLRSVYIRKRLSGKDGECATPVEICLDGRVDGNRVRLWAGSGRKRAKSVAEMDGWGQAVSKRITENKPASPVRTLDDAPEEDALVPFAKLPYSHI